MNSIIMPCSVTSCISPSFKGCEVVVQTSHMWFKVEVKIPQDAQFFGASSEPIEKILYFSKKNRGMLEDGGLFMVVHKIFGFPLTLKVMASNVLYDPCDSRVIC